MSDRDSYLLGVDASASARLNLQHFWVTSTCGFLIHPDIQVPSQAKIADIATGTGVWPIEVSIAHPSASIDGFDITDAQFPPKEWRPSNVSLNRLNILEPLPEEQIRKYDIVNIRYFAVAIRKNNYATLLKNLYLMLKPGGYLQWIDNDLEGIRAVACNSNVVTIQLENQQAEVGRFMKLAGMSYSFLHELPDTLREMGMVKVNQIKPINIPGLRSIFSYVVVEGWMEMFRTGVDTKDSHPIFGSAEVFREKIIRAQKEIASGAAVEVQLYVTVAQRPT